MTYNVFSGTLNPTQSINPACIQGPASISTIMLDPRPVFEARLVFKAQPLLVRLC